MARVTVEDCIKIIPNRFELVVLASRRAKDISSGAEIKVEKDNDKEAVIALREVAESKLAKDYLLEEVVSSYQTNTQYVAEKLADDIKESHNDQAPLINTAKAEQAFFAEDNLAIED